MRLYLLLAFGLLPIISYSQSSPERLYRKAYAAIVTSPEFQFLRGKNPCVAVFDSIVYQNQANFSEQLAKQWRYIGYHKANRLRDSLYTVDQTTFHKPYFSPITADLTTISGEEQGCLVILFSRLNHNMLLAEVNDNQNGGRGVKHILSVFDQSIAYLFLFNAAGDIEQYYAENINYN